MVVFEWWFLYIFQVLTKRCKGRLGGHKAWQVMPSLVRLWFRCGFKFIKKFVETVRELQHT